jgi:hypothetical protein
LPRDFRKLSRRSWSRRRWTRLASGSKSLKDRMALDKLSIALTNPSETEVAEVRWKRSISPLSLVITALSVSLTYLRPNSPGSLWEGFGTYIRSVYLLSQLESYVFCIKS